ncbi:MAG: AprI/Inh family metalloprotease inhibitor [Devosia sp.]
MTNSWRGLALTLAAIGTAALLQGCASAGVSVSNVGETEQLAPVQQGNVSTTALPPLGPNGEVQGPEPIDPNAAPTTDTFGPAPTDTTQTADTEGSFGVLEPVGALPNSSGRDLTGGLTVDKLLGGWTVVSGGDQCQLNLTKTAKTGTTRFRASSPACVIKSLAVVASWQLAGSQVQLFDENGDMIGTLILSGNRFIGTLAGGQGISMVG